MGFSIKSMKNGKLSFERKFAHFFYREAKELNAADLSPEKVRARIDAFNRAMQKQLKKNKKCLEFLADLRQVIQQYCAKERVKPFRRSHSRAAHSVTAVSAVPVAVNRPVRRPRRITLASPVANTVNASSRTSICRRRKTPDGVH